MCGIIGVTGTGPAVPRLIDSLKRLEYRGYDSAGVAALVDGRIERRRAKGKIRELEAVLLAEPLSSTIGIGHTRWATHGAPTTANAHPHKAGRVVLVHNGIIENFAELKAELTAEGHVFESQTDTEVVAHALDRALETANDPMVAFKNVLDRLTGAYALAVLIEGEDGLILGARRGSPLVVGWGEGEMYLGSDALAVGPFTQKISYLEEGDWAVITRQGAEIFDQADRRANRAETRIQIERARIEKAGYKHFMAKEIAEQPVVIADALKHYIGADGASLRLPAGVDFTGVDRVVMVACGTASYACHVAKYWFEQIAGLPAEVDIASEFRYRDPVLSEKSWAVFVSQSGETADTLAALRHCKEKVAKVVSVVNVPTSSIARESDLSLPIMAGVEVGVASTKAFTT
jgi:glucosamine--fructose-6-phosphate aminotransferase (isomerizing)